MPFLEAVGSLFAISVSIYLLVFRLGSSEAQCYLRSGTPQEI